MLNIFFQNKEFSDNSPKSRFEVSKEKNDESNDSKEMNNKFLPSRLQKQFEQNNDTNKSLNASSISKE